MTYNVFGGTLNPTLHYTILYYRQKMLQGTFQCHSDKRVREGDVKTIVNTEN